MAGPRIVLDTNVFVGALIGREGHNRRVIRACLLEQTQPVIGQALFLEYQDVLSRGNLFRTSPLSSSEHMELFHAFLGICDWVHVYYSWRPNLPDEGDNHLLELAIAGGVDAVVTNNVKDFVRGELHFPEISILTPVQFLKEML
jgi:uncharacterized protein